MRQQCNCIHCGAKFTAPFHYEYCKDCHEKGIAQLAWDARAILRTCTNCNTRFTSNNSNKICSDCFMREQNTLSAIQDRPLSANDQIPLWCDACNSSHFSYGDHGQTYKEASVFSCDHHILSVMKASQHGLFVFINSKSQDAPFIEPSMPQNSDVEGLKLQLKLITDALERANLHIRVEKNGKEWVINDKDGMRYVRTVPEILRNAAETYEQRNKLYGDNYKRFGAIMEVLLPDGIELTSEEEWNRFGIFFHIVGKVTRYAANINRGGHLDSAHDLAVYATMLEELTQETK